MWLPLLTSSLVRNIINTPSIIYTSICGNVVDGAETSEVFLMSLIFWLVLSPRVSPMFLLWSALAIPFVFRRVTYSLPKCVARLRSTLVF